APAYITSTCCKASGSNRGRGRRSSTGWMVVVAMVSDASDLCRAPVVVGVRAAANFRPSGYHVYSGGAGCPVVVRQPAPAFARSVGNIRRPYQAAISVRGVDRVVQGEADL